MRPPHEYLMHLTSRRPKIIQFDCILIFMPSELIPDVNLQAAHAIGKARQTKFYWTSSLELNKLGKLFHRTFRSWYSPKELCLMWIDALLQ